ncbi:hypothetical protein QBC42DRAFT_269237 [Cladorrhinum samala]|uniref:NADH dehydrogenase subunit 6 n=1 Tax=Cladorrhinum samala TaxID=585594 RepID=A0AAV9HPM1_9PEZI|nr:hypothetical protein QBC42DRAFT_269237 [Cladorrhinum samala]
MWVFSFSLVFSLSTALVTTLSCVSKGSRFVDMWILVVVVLLLLLLLSSLSLFPSL